jgi:hypothetical protein
VALATSQVTCLKGIYLKALLEQGGVHSIQVRRVKMLKIGKAEHFLFLNNNIFQNS